MSFGDEQRNSVITSFAGLRALLAQGNIYVTLLEAL
jgi:hypothetical protein